MARYRTTSAVKGKIGHAALLLGFMSSLWTPGCIAVNTDEEQIRVLLAPAQETTLSSGMPARVREVLVTLGSSFKTGQTLVRFECAEQEARLKMSAAELAAARESHEAKLRLQGLQQAGEVEVALAASAVEKAGAQQDLYRAQREQCELTAPFSGRAVRVTVRAHESVGAGQALLDLVSDGPLKLRLNVPGKWVSWLRAGTPFTISVDETSREYAATVTALNARVDAMSQTIEIEGRLSAQAEELLPGMSGTAQFTPPSR